MGSENILSQGSQKQFECQNFAFIASSYNCDTFLKIHELRKTEGGQLLSNRLQIFNNNYFNGVNFKAAS